jgi:hypothetical protein
MQTGADLSMRSVQILVHPCPPKIHKSEIPIFFPEPSASRPYLTSKDVIDSSNFCGTNAANELLIAGPKTGNGSIRSRGKKL